MSENRLGLFGGSFDPIHLGHLITASSVAEQLDLQQVIFIPSAMPPHKQYEKLTAPRHRLAMTKLAVRDNPRFTASDIELKRTGPCYTILTIRDMKAAHGQAELFWIIGADSLPELPTWYNIEQLLVECHIVTTSRPGWENQQALQHLADRFNPDQINLIKQNVLTTPRIEISATDIRRRVAAGRSIQYLVPEAVRNYIMEHNLYTTSQHGSPCQSQEGGDPP